MRVYSIQSSIPITSKTSKNQNFIRLCSGNLFLMSNEFPNLAGIHGNKYLTEQLMSFTTISVPSNDKRIFCFRHKIGIIAIFKFSRRANLCLQFMLTQLVDMWMKLKFSFIVGGSTNIAFK